MTPRFVALSMLLFCVGVFGVASTVNQFGIVNAVNAKLPPEDQFGYLGWYMSKTLRLHQQYRQLYPEGRLLRRTGVLFGLMWFCMVLTMRLVGFGFLTMTWFGAVGVLLV